MSRRKRGDEKMERTSEELADLKAERERFSRDRPGPDDLVDSDEYDGPIRQGNIMALLSALAELQRQRTLRGLSLADVSKRSGLDRAMVSRLENGKILNPMMSTLWRYADAVGAQVHLAIEPTSVAADP